MRTPRGPRLPSRYGRSTRRASFGAEVLRDHSRTPARSPLDAMVRLEMTRSRRLRCFLPDLRDVVRSAQRAEEGERRGADHVMNEEVGPVAKVSSEDPKVLNA